MYEMLPQVATSSSNLSAGLQLRDIAAVIAIGVSLLTWFRSRKIEERIRADGDARAGFDLVFGNPLTARLEPLDAIISEFIASVRNSSSMPAIDAAVSTIQKHDHSDWYFAMLSFLDSHPQEPSRFLASELQEYWDQSSHIINQIGTATSPTRALSLCRQLRTLGDRYLGRSRRILFDERVSLQGTIPPFLPKLPFWVRR